jgi:hypothetical protein
MNSWRGRVIEWSSRTSLATYSLIGMGIIGLQAAVLLEMSQPPICECGYVKLWGGIISSPEYSQHLTDWHSYSHVVHGIVFYLLLWLIAPQLPIGLRFLLALGLEAGWEILENTPFIINRYRQTALAQGYFGDSVINSVSDTIAMTFGFGFARILPVWTIGGLVVGTELFTAYMIRDNLTLNIIQLIFPFETISNWQAGV